VSDAPIDEILDDIRATIDQIEAIRSRRAGATVDAREAVVLDLAAARARRAASAPADTVAQDDGTPIERAWRNLGHVDRDLRPALDESTAAHPAGVVLPWRYRGRA
jgi:hypothetical protein